MIDKVRVNVTERDRWSGPSNWYRDFDTVPEAQAFFDELRSKLGVEASTPETYDVPESIYLIKIDEDSNAVYTGERLQ